jgi:glycosyltransferase involved in cell wall biosynthesis
VIHVVGLPHTEAVRDPSWCAFTSQLLTFAEMVQAGGRDITLYAGPTTDADCELVTVVDDPPSNPIDFNPDALHWQDMNRRVIDELYERAQLGDIIALSAGRAQKQIADGRPELTAIEYAVGYAGPFANYRAYPSYAWMHAVMGAESGDAGKADGRFYDQVIPHAVQPQKLHAGGDYLLYVGRLEERKGLAVIRDIAQRTGRKVLVAGQGPAEVPEECEYLGVLGPDERTEVMGGAHALLAPSLYLEPFGLVAVEAMQVGTPVISTDWGAFPETVANRVSGFRCRTLHDFLEATEMDFDRAQVRAYGQRFTPQVIGPLYHEWLTRIETLNSDGWYTAT